MSNGTKNGQVLTELQQLRSIVLGEYTLEVDQRLHDLEVKLRNAQVDLAQAIDDANTLGNNEVQAVRDLIDEKIEKMQFDVTNELKTIQGQLAQIQESFVDKKQLGSLMIQLGQQIQADSAK